ncbi:PLP-dependent cysteine synthase family protein [Pigmentibacter sp. JX0631]|uniref:PLP-dependent cysteine synthase family protein n=1 Tax=Pigmentibacter sp. JX0631 TaxID=2976982 RepID=UPI0024689D3C|nr:PLP-dependent cysteine synthase family protein [Pigmentibacter sp. JX0631]WGL59520.1 PLP-dependent cysteine synthase family protein [Pigmentibacter sp. JX0631]
MNKSWLKEAMKKIEADFNRSSDTHLFKVSVPQLKNIDLYFKDESAHPTGSLKHRLARSLFLYALCNGFLNEKSTVIESSSGSTAVSEAYFAKMLGLKFIAVMPENTSKEKIAKIEFYGGYCHLVKNPTEVSNEALKLGKNKNSYFMNQFLYAEKATDWRGNNNIAEAIFLQMNKERFPIPKWIVIGAGTGGTSATIGRYIRYKSLDTQVCVVDPEQSVFYDYYNKKITEDFEANFSSKIEGIGRPRVEKSFIKEIVDQMLKIPDSASIAAMHYLADFLDYKRGPSTGTNFCGVIEIIKQMQKKKEEGSIVTLLCDSGERYANTYYNFNWLEKNNFFIKDYYNDISNFFKKLK